MMNRIIQLIFITLLMSGCDEFIEPSIDTKRVALLAPVQGTETTDYAQSFWWQEVDNAFKYRLQVVSPDFTNTRQLVLDTLVATNKFNFTLSPGNYEWRVRAENGSSQTPYTTAAFVIYTSSIKAQQAQLQTPANGTLTNVNSANFSWLKLYGADKYRLEIDTNGFADEGTLFFDQTTPNLSVNVNFTREKLYQWRVKALNDTAESKWSAIRNLSFDGTPPAAVVLSAPITNASVSSPVILSWNVAATATRYQLYVYKNDQAVAYSATFPLTTTGTTYSFIGTPGEKIYWQVRAIDAAGNTGVFSEMRDFTIQ